MKTIVLVCFILLVSFFLFSITSGGEASAVSGVQIYPGDMETAIECMVIKEARQQAGSIVYKNAQYGFEFTLPASWKGYKIVTDKWEGLPAGGETPVETGPIIIIRNPLWTEEIPYQDIPIMILTTAQWDSLQKGDFHIGAAPIGPSELGRNSEYVFALPARYNYSFPAGYEEVENILSRKPLKPIEMTGAISQ